MKTGGTFLLTYWHENSTWPFFLAVSVICTWHCRGHSDSEFGKQRSHSREKHGGAKSLLCPPGGRCWQQGSLQDETQVVNCISIYLLYSLQPCFVVILVIQPPHNYGHPREVSQITFTICLKLILLSHLGIQVTLVFRSGQLTSPTGDLNKEIPLWQHVNCS